MANVDRDWDERYTSGQTPWDSQRPSKELGRLLAKYRAPGGRALELGCGTGTNAIALASQGFQVTAVDCSPTALRMARDKAAAAQVEIEWIEADVQNFGMGVEPFDLLIDRGCYHCCRRVDLPGFLRTLQTVTRPGSLFLCLIGNADEDVPGPPRVRAAEVCGELEPLFQIHELSAFRFEDAGGLEGPLGWSLAAERRSV